MLVRSYSRNSGRIRCETESGFPRSASAAATASSFSGLANENNNETAMASGATLIIASRSLVNSASDGRSRMRPLQSVLSATPNRISRRTNGATRSKKKSYSRGRACRPISMTSSNPEVVINATRAPLRCNSAFVPTVVPCSNVTAARAPLFLSIPPGLFAAPPICLSASPIAREGSSGVENTLSVLSAPSSTQTQSVNVPPVSIATQSTEPDSG